MFPSSGITPHHAAAPALTHFHHFFFFSLNNFAAHFLFHLMHTGFLLQVYMHAQIHVHNHKPIFSCINIHTHMFIGEYYGWFV